MLKQLWHVLLIRPALQLLEGLAHVRGAQHLRHGAEMRPARGTEAALENAAEAMRVHGGYGYSTEFPVERLYRDAPLLVIGEGTNELQRIIIARQLVARNPV